MALDSTPINLSLFQGFEGTLVWESLDSAALTTVNSSSVQLSDGGGVLKISSVCVRTQYLEGDI